MSTAKRPIRKIACVGEVMIEMIATSETDAKLGVAGDTFNTAVYLNRALRDTDVSVAYVTALGTDSYSDRIMNALSGHALDTSYVERRDGIMPGLYAIETDDEGERSFSYWRSAAAARTLFSMPCDVTLDRLNDFDMVLLSGISMAILPQSIRESILDWADEFCANGGTLVYDSNHRPRLWESVEVARTVNSSMWTRADIALPSVDDEMALYDDPTPEAVLDRLTKLGVARGALKRGSEGPMDLASGETPTDLPSVSKVIDTTAAGDSFNAGFLGAIAKGETDLDAAAAGHRLAAMVICHPGAILPE
ncbi:sugar kinase [Cognatishimia sp.]|uniref:sugar kinase n=1 Tax=Cognatishimia sp. TaxID=2211648 RepID=UPI003BA9B897